jgi:hypothetical protein
MKEELLAGIIELIAPGVISKNFEVTSIIEKRDTITIVFEEKTDLVPKELEGKQVVLDGFLNPVALQTFPLKDKMVYLSLKRRRWKEPGTTGKSYSNTYELHRQGMKTTNEFGNFLKEELGLRPSEYNKLWKSTTP